MRDLNYDLKQLCWRHRDGSYASQDNRERILDLIANQLQEMGFRHMQATSPKHVDTLVARWHTEQRYKELTGRNCTAVGGNPSKKFSAEKKMLDREAHLIISSELGHKLLNKIIKGPRR